MKRRLFPGNILCSASETVCFIDSGESAATSFLGKEVSVSGKIFDATGKTTVPNALVEVWHLSPEKEVYKHRGKMFTDVDGSYQFITDWPNREPGKQHRIYFKVSNEGKTIFTELLFSEFGANISGVHWENNQCLEEELRFPKFNTFLNKSTINFNISINN